MLLVIMTLGLGRKIAGDCGGITGYLIYVGVDKNIYNI